MSGHLRLWRVDAHLIVLDVVAIHLDRGFPVFVFDGVGIGLEVLDELLAHPAAHAREGRQPGVEVGAGAGGHLHGNLFPGAWRGLEGIVEQGFQGDERRLDRSFIDEHGMPQ
ncbi:hypothetical protein D3C81_1796750 [compost metagenome]